MTEIVNLLSEVNDNDRAVFITALKEFPKAARQYTHDPSAASLNKKMAKSAINKIEVKARRFSADEIRVLYLALFLLNENIATAQENGFSDNTSNQVLQTIDKFLPPLEEFVNNLLD
ncbi:hypothetical protein [Lysinibacillus capsici]|uniref:hypothetical protein n=1 Tax=Lysinibacillus capsici TaxID=2115968 RepID=UPI00289E101A|nr:hypothetical protein [Lysinibacillus capsici]